MEWINIRERAPPQDTYVLVAKYDDRKNVKMYFIQIASKLGSEWFDDRDGNLLERKYGYITHWMPIPDSPDEFCNKCKNEHVACVC